MQTHHAQLTEQQDILLGPHWRRQDRVQAQPAPEAAYLDNLPQEGMGQHPGRQPQGAAEGGTVCLRQMGQRP